MRIKNSMKKILLGFVSLMLLAGLGVQASDLIIESKTNRLTNLIIKLNLTGM